MMTRLECRKIKILFLQDSGFFTSAWLWPAIGAMAQGPPAITDLDKNVADSKPKNRVDRTRALNK